MIIEPALVPAKNRALRMNPTIPNPFWQPGALAFNIPGFPELPHERGRSWQRLNIY